MLPGTVRHPAHFQLGFPKLLSTEEDTKRLQLPVPKFVGKGKALVLIFEQVKILKPLRKGTYLQIIDLRKRKKEKGSGIWEKGNQGLPFNGKHHCFL